MLTRVRSCLAEMFQDIRTVTTLFNDITPTVSKYWEGPGMTSVSPCALIVGVSLQPVCLLTRMSLTRYVILHPRLRDLQSHHVCWDCQAGMPCLCLWPRASLFGRGVGGFSCVVTGVLCIETHFLLSWQWRCRPTPAPRLRLTPASPAMLLATPPLPSPPPPTPGPAPSTTPKRFNF